MIQEAIPTLSVFTANPGVLFLADVAVGTPAFTLGHAVRIEAFGEQSVEKDGHGDVVADAHAAQTQELGNPELPALSDVVGRHLADFSQQLFDGSGGLHRVTSRALSARVSYFPGWLNLLGMNSGSSWTRRSKLRKS